MPPFHFDFPGLARHSEQPAKAPSEPEAKWKLSRLKATNLGSIVRSSSNSLLSQLRPQGVGTCDHTRLERVANLATSFLYIGLGIKTMQQCRSRDGKAYGLSVCGAGAGSLAFHSTSGKWRETGRRLDYWAIAVSTAFLQRELDPKLPKWVTGASLAVTPFRPFVVSAGNTTALEVRYALRAKRDTTFRRRFLDHVTCGAAGMTCFYLEEHYPNNPCIHPAWHVLAALSVQSIRPLIDDIEKRRDGPRDTKGIA